MFCTSSPSGQKKGPRFLLLVISYAVWAYNRFALSLQDVEGLHAERGRLVCLETIRTWIGKFVLEITKRARLNLKRMVFRLGGHPGQRRQTLALACAGQHGFLVSMSGEGNCYDNSNVESFFKSLEA